MTPAAGEPRPVEVRDAARACNVREIGNEAAFCALAKPWNALAQCASNASAFLSHEWFTAAWAWRGQTASLALLVFDAPDRVDAVLPLIRASASPRRLELLTVPDTQVADMLADEDSAAAAADAFAEVLAKRRDWDTLHLDYLRADGLLARHLVGALRRRGVRTDLQTSGDNRCIDLDGGWDDYFSTRSRRLKKALNLAGNRLRKAGEVRIDWVDASADAARRDRALDAAIAISAASWKARTGNSLDRSGPQAFIRSLSASAAQRGWLSLWLLSLDDKPLAMEYQLVSQGNVHALRSDFRTDCDELSPGTNLFRHLLQALFEKGLVRYYLGPGDNPYKARWAEGGTPLVRVRAYNITLRGRLAWFTEVVAKPRLRRVRDRWRNRHAAIEGAAE